MLYSLARPFIFNLDAEKAHGLTLAGLKMLPIAGAPDFDPILKHNVAGIDFASPVGLAPGFDKNGEVPRTMLGLGFGFAEIGTLTPKPQSGNPKPRLFRLVEDRAVINRLGFNNDGQPAAIARLQRELKRPLPGILGINIGANKDSQDRISDYAIGVANMVPFADYLTVNISSPNTPGLRALQDEGALTDLLDGVNSALAEAQHGHVPIFLKLAPDLEPADIDAIVRIALDKKLAALIISNTTITRPELASRHAQETGGLSGAPLASLAMQRLKDFRAASGGHIPLIAVGGIDSAESAYDRIRAGASLIQIYSALVYHGPGLARTINDGLTRLLKRDGFTNIADAIGVDA
ncbi:quinone-dependent dihydroorotate dehydrogenase [Parasphingorhabdus sp. DH2-15]|uniref:quinone-dependent dihydroorotate dehydrogenase n=1 Tax=Parasphingorhabdus sp. DH2-15 TaxID=3444112 RepID=UPI003F684DCA